VVSRRLVDLRSGPARRARGRGHRGADPVRRAPRGAGVRERQDRPGRRAGTDREAVDDPKRPVQPAPRDAPPPPPTPLDASPTDATNPDSTAPPGRLGSPQGHALATGGPAEISGFDDPDFTYSYYAEQMLARIRERWQRPELGGSIEMVVHFRVQKDGKVTDVEILKSSGYNSFDRAGLRAVETATMPPLPKSYRRSELGVHLIIR
jgi:TonB family protein